MKQLIISSIFLIILSFSVSGQSVKRAYKALEKKDFSKAYDEFKDVLSKDRTNPAAQFGITVLYSQKGTGYYDIFNAWKKADETQKNINKLSADDMEIMKEYFINTETRRSSRPVKNKMEIYIEDVKTQLIRFIREENNLEVVNQFLKEFKDFENYDNVIHIRNYIEFRKAESENNLAAMEEFIRKRPDAAQIEVAREKRNEMAFQKAKALNTIDALNNFITSYPAAIRIPEAEMIRNGLEFNRVKQVNNFDVYEQYIEKYPNSSHIPKIRELQKILVYEEAKKINTIEAYSKFISMYPDGAQYIDIFNLKTKELGKKFNMMNSEFKAASVWTRGFDNEESDNIARDLALEMDGSIIMAGATLQDDTSTFYDAWIVKLDKNQNMAWNKVIGERWDDIPKKIITDKTNNIIVAGVINRINDTIPGQSWIFKLNQKGEKIWNRKMKNLPEILTMDVNAKNQIILGGYEKNDTLPDNYLIYKLTPQGRKFWKRSYTDFGRVNDVKTTENNGIVVAGDKRIWKLNDMGYIEWEKEIQSTDSIVSVHELENGDLVFLGNRNKSDCLLIMLNKRGKEIFEKSFGANAGVCEPIDIVSNATSLIFCIKLDNYYKLLNSDLKGNLTNEFDFNPSVVSNIAAIHSIGDGTNALLVTADNLGQKKDIIVSIIK